MNEKHKRQEKEALENFLKHMREAVKEWRKNNGN